MFQDRTLEWDKTFLMFIPSKELLSKIKDMSVDICFTNANEIRLPECNEKTSITKRVISID